MMEVWKQSFEICRNNSALIRNSGSIQLQKLCEHPIFFSSLSIPFFYCNLVWVYTYRTRNKKQPCSSWNFQEAGDQNYSLNPSFDARTDPFFNNRGILKFHDIYI